MGKKKVMHKYYEQASSKSQGKASFAYAWVLDATSEDYGVTMDIAQREFQTESRHITLSDAPGHRDFFSI